MGFEKHCLDAGDNPSDGSKLQLRECALIPQQTWTPNGESTFKLSETDLCIDLTDGNVAEGTQLQVWTCDTANVNQQWRTPS